MKSVLCLISSLSGGGAERQMLELIRYLCGHGYRVKLLTYAGSDDYPCPPQVERIRVRASGKLGLALRLRRAILRSGCDCVVSFMQQNNFVAALAALPRKRFGLIVSERSLSAGPGKFERLLFRLYRRSDWVVPNSVSQSRYIAAHSSGLESKIVTVGNFTDTERFCPAAPPPEDGYVKIGVFARYVPGKNPKLLVEALDRLRGKGVENVKVFWFGSRYPNKNKPQEVAPCYIELERLVSEKGLGERFVLNDFSADPVADIGRMDAVAMPSFAEGFSNAISEGMACGKPVLASAVSDNPLLVEEGVGGFLFDPYDPDSAAGAIGRLLSLSSQERLEMGRRNRLRAEAMFSLERYGKSYAELIERACNGKTRGK